MIRKINQNDKDTYIKLSKQFFSSDAVLHNIPEQNIMDTFDQLMNGSPFADGYIIEHKGKVAGYALLAITWSNEAGGIAIWIEEIFILPEYQGLGLGRAFMEFIKEKYKGKAARIRLEVEESNQKAFGFYKKLGFEELPYMQMIIDDKKE